MPKLNIGSGPIPIGGYIDVDRKLGSEAYPLDWPDESIDEVRASHVLEHFGHADALKAVADWVRVLKPGGVLKIAVPDFKWITSQYLAGTKENIGGILFGGQQDQDDYHKTVFDEGRLTEVLHDSGIVDVQRWESEIEDCARLPCSLNLMGYKGLRALPKISAVMSMPRLAFADNMFCALGVVTSLGIPFTKVTGAFWGQCLERVMSQHLDGDAKYILTCDYDSVFQPTHVRRLAMIMEARPDIDAIAPIQAKRGQDHYLMGLLQPNGEEYPAGSTVPLESFKPEVSRAAWAHFGLTLIRVSALKDMPHPWFMGTPNKTGEWGEGRVDDDIFFWRKWHANRKTLYLANRVPLGHAQLMFTWPSLNGPIHQYPDTYNEVGMPAEVWK